MKMSLCNLDLTRLNMQDGIKFKLKKPAGRQHLNCDLLKIFEPIFVEYTKKSRSYYELKLYKFHHWRQHGVRKHTKTLLIPTAYT